MSEMVERVLDLALSLGFQANEGDIRLLIAEMREPTDAMLLAGCEQIRGFDDHCEDGPVAGDCWHAMVDAALAT